MLKRSRSGGANTRACSAGACEQHRCLSVRRTLIVRRLPTSTPISNAGADEALQYSALWRSQRRYEVDINGIPTSPRASGARHHECVRDIRSGSYMQRRSRLSKMQQIHRWIVIRSLMPLNGACSLCRSLFMPTIVRLAAHLQNSCRECFPAAHWSAFLQQPYF